MDRVKSPNWAITAANSLSDVLAMIASVCIIAVAVGTTVDVALRTATGHGVRGLTDYAVLLMVAIIFLSLPYAQKTNSHIQVDVVTDLMPTRVQTVIVLANYLLVAVISAWIGFINLESAFESFRIQETRFGLVEVVVWPAKAALAIGFLALAIQSLAQFVSAVVGNRIRRVEP